MLHLYAPSDRTRPPGSVFVLYPFTGSFTAAYLNLYLWSNLSHSVLFSLFKCPPHVFSGTCCSFNLVDQWCWRQLRALIQCGCCLPAWKEIYCLVAQFHLYDWYQELTITSYEFQIRYSLSSQTREFLKPAFRWINTALVSCAFSQRSTLTRTVITAVALHHVVY